MTPKKIALYAIGPIAGAALSLITLPTIAWFFTVEDVGRIAMLQLVIGLTVSLFSLSMHQAYVREYHEVIDKPALFKTSILPGLILLIATTLIFLIVPIPISISKYLFGINSNVLTSLLLIGVFSSYCINFLLHVIRMQERALAFSISQVAPRVFLLILIGTIVLCNINADFQSLIFANTLAVFVSLIIFSLLTRSTWIGFFAIKIKKDLLLKMLRFSLPLVVGGLAYWGLNTMDRFYLRSMSGFKELGVYALAVTLAGSVSVITVVFANIWHPTVYKWIKEGIKTDKVNAVTENMLLIVTFIWSVIGIFSWVIPHFFPHDYKALEYLVVACVSMPLLYLLSETTVIGIGITRKTNFAMLSSVLAFIVNAILNYILIPKYGASGAALASLASIFIFFIVRTESSAWLWQSLPRTKVYIILILYILATTIMVLTENKIKYFEIVWLILLILTASLFIKRIQTSWIFMNDYFNRTI